MGTAGNGDGRPDGGGPPEGLPGLPPEWGSIVIPDDPAELADEAAQLRAELRRRNRRTAWRRLFGLPPAPGVDIPSPPRSPLLILLVAVLTTLVSLFAVVRTTQRTPQQTAPTTGTPVQRVPAMDLIREDGALVPLRSLLPAVLVFVDGCTCVDELNLAARTVPPGVTVVALTSETRPSATPGQPPVAPIRSLVDPTAQLAAALRLSPRPDPATTLLVARSGGIVRILPSTNGLAEHPAELAELGNR
ncbi:hypothetical protein GCM10027290_35020 [Micromonospora sonneratiae]|uniref:Uncharacterized protein n=1 Tax=Micromonospora sonneratiae TaxID=1184706 RepID=A0ABW3YBH6_9ACTN